jgi:formyl-CoA transferase
MPGPLDGVRVIDLTAMLAGPYATMLLADLGAEVVKVEPPRGDPTRRVGPFRETDGPDGLAGYFQSVNRGKRSVVLDLKTDEGRAKLRDLARIADVLVENYSAGVMERLGLSYELLHADNPRLVYAAVRGFGDPAPAAAPTGTGLPTTSSRRPLAAFLASPAPPIKHRSSPDPGSATCSPRYCWRSASSPHCTMQRKPVKVSSSTSRCTTPCFRCASASCISTPTPDRCQSSKAQPPAALPVRHPADRRRLGGIGGQQPALGQGRHRHRATRHGDRQAVRHQRGSTPHQTRVRAALKEWLSARTTKEVLNTFGGSVPIGPVNTVADIFADEHVAARDMLVAVEQPGSDRPVTLAGQPIKFTETPSSAITRGPLLGEHDIDRIVDEWSITPTR